MHELTVATSVARALMEFAASRGACPRSLAERAGIDPAELLDADRRVTFDKYVALMRAGQELCHDPALALHFGESVDVSEISIACMAGAPSGNWADGFAQMNRYARLTVDLDATGGDRFVMERSAGQVWVIDTRKNPNDFPELTESTFARAVCFSRRHLGGKQIVKALHVTHPAPSYRAEYDRIFQTTVVFESDRNAMLTDDDWLSYNTPILPRTVTEVLRAHAEALLEKLESSRTIRGRVEGLLTPILHTGEARIEIVAGKLGLSRQTLFRKLKAEGTTFEKVLDELRHKMALQYLSMENASVNEAAYRVGFSDPAAFSRAFKRWTGSCPRALLSSIRAT